MSHIPNHRELVAELVRQHWVVVETKRGHYRAIPPGNADPVVFCESADPRGMKNNLAQLRRGNAFEWPPPKQRKAKQKAPLGPADLDKLYGNLKESRVALTEAQQGYDQAESVHAQAAERLAQAQEDLDAAKRLVAESKVEFDEAFEVSR